MTFEQQFHFIDLDGTCWKFKIVELANRGEFLHHVENKTNEQMINVLEKYNVIPDLVVKSFHRYALKNIFVEICKEFNANILLKRGIVTQ